MAKKGSQHVTPRDGGKWAVKTAGSSRASSTHDTQKEAIDVARERAKERKTEMYIHRRDGTIRDRNSYGNDPYPPPG